MYNLKNKNFFLNLVYKLTFGLVRKIYFYSRKAFLYLTINKFPRIYRPDSIPYISGDSFRAKSDHIHDESMKLNPYKVNENDLVFLNADFFVDYFENIHPKINHNYVLITHNSDVDIDDSLEKYFDEKIIKCYSQNLSILNNPKLNFLPVGLENRRHLKNGIKSHFKKAKYSYTTNKQTKIISAFNKFTALDEREELDNLIKNFEIIDILPPVNHKKYMDALSKYKFALCPLGNGPDTHRLWEALMVCTIPVMINCNFTKNLVLNGIPVLVVDSWSEISDITPDYLEIFYKQHIDKESIDLLTSFKFWYEKIRTL